MTKIRNYSRYILSKEEEKALSFGLDEHIPTTFNRNKLFVEFETFHQNILNDISHVPVDDIPDSKLNYVTPAKGIEKLKYPTNIVP